MRQELDFYIDGEWVSPANANAFDVIDPASEEAFAQISLGSSTDVDRAVAAARAAFPGWAATSLEERIALLKKLQEIMVSRNDEMGDIISMEMGAPIDLARDAQAAVGHKHLNGFLKAIESFTWEEPYGPNEKVVREPIGVCGFITPWNWPMNQVALKVFPALLTGCTCVLKPSEVSPLSAMLFTRMVDEAGFPKGVFNLVNGDGATVGAAISSHTDVDLVSFTGSTRAGILVSKAAADTIKRVTLELGGKSPNVVFADADLDGAIARGLDHVFENSGQSCNAPTRMLVERSIYDQAVDLAVQKGSEYKVGSPREHGDHIGPVVSKVQYDRIQALIEAGIDEGARLVLGGPGRPEGFNRGYYVKPTIFADVNNQMRIAREEVFGPVLAMIPFDDESEAIEIGNDTPYGLASYVQTKDLDKAERVARALRTGTVAVNGHGMSRGHPFGGYKQSGLGREGGKWGIEEFLETKIIGGAA